MPFTLAHPAAAVPWARLKLPLSALVVGSMAPDFPYFLHLSTGTSYGHSPLGLFWFCLPAGLAVLGLFHALLKFPLLSLLPPPHQARLLPVASAFRFGPALRFLSLLLGLLLGAVTHIVWDSFTHANGWSVQHVALLQTPLMSTTHGTLYLFKVLQHGSTVFGISLLAYWYWRWFIEVTPGAVILPVQLSGSLKVRLLLLMLFLAAATAGVCSFWMAPAITGGSWLQLLVRNWVVLGVGGLFVEVFIFSLLWHIKLSQNK